MWLDFITIKDGILTIKNSGVMQTMWLIDGWVVYIGACATVPGLVWTMYYKSIMY
jgi:hypothetical protein